MTLNGEILKAYNNLPAIPIEQPLGDLLNTIPVGNPALENPTGGTATLYVSASGSDDTGDGSQANPYATPQMAIDAIPATAAKGTVFVVECGAGIFDFPDVSVVPEGVFVFVVGDRSNPVLSLPAGAVTFTKVPGQQAVWTANVGPYSPNITEGDFWIFREGTPLSTFGSAVLPTTSAAPDLNIVSSVNIGTTAFSLYQTTTVFRVSNLRTYSSKELVFVGQNFPSSRRQIKFYGIRLLLEDSSSFIDFVGIHLLGCSVTGTTFATLKLAHCFVQGTYFSDSFPLTIQLQDQNGIYACVYRRYFTSSGTNLVSSGIYEGFASVSRTDILILSSLINFEGTSNCITLVSGNIEFSIANIYVQNTKSSLLSTVSFTSPFWLTFSSSTVTGSVTGTAVTLVNGAQAIGIKAACNGTLTTGGSEIVIGGNTGQTFASLPATDAGAAAPQFCRAT